MAPANMRGWKTPPPRNAFCAAPPRMTRSALLNVVFVQLPGIEVLVQPVPLVYALLPPIDRSAKPYEPGARVNAAICGTGTTVRFVSWV